MAFYDMHRIEEDDRIEAIGQTAMHKHGDVAFMVDKGGEHQGKGDRYINKLLLKFPLLEVIKRFDGPVKGVETIVIREKVN